MKRKLLKRCMDTEEQRKYWAFIDRMVREYWASRNIIKKAKEGNK